MKQHHLNTTCTAGGHKRLDSDSWMGRGRGRKCVWGGGAQVTCDGCPMTLSSLLLEPHLRVPAWSYHSSKLPLLRCSSTASCSCPTIPATSQLDHGTARQAGGCVCVRGRDPWGCCYIDTLYLSRVAPALCVQEYYIRGVVCNSVIVGNAVVCSCWSSCCGRGRHRW